MTFPGEPVRLLFLVAGAGTIGICLGTLLVLALVQINWLHTNSGMSYSEWVRGHLGKILIALGAGILAWGLAFTAPQPTAPAVPIEFHP
jgi:hypothetical protein